jgi:signal transduction histidine kinase
MLTGNPSNDPASKARVAHADASPGPVMLRGIPIGWKLLALVGLFLVGFGAFGVFAFHSLHTVQVNGPIYARIVQSKDLSADVLPPPEYIIESYLLVLEMLARAESGADPPTLQRLTDKGKELRAEYESRHAFWVKNLRDGELKQALTVASYEPAMRFYRVRDERLIPVLLAGRLQDARDLQRADLEPAYQEHREAIDRVVQLAAESASQDEADASRGISQTTTALLVIGLLTAGVCATASIFLARAITLPLSTIAGVAQDVARGTLDPAPLAKITSRDEVGTLAQAFAVMTERLRETLEGWRTKNAELERFTYVVSHDLKSPLITIKGFIGYVEEAVAAGDVGRMKRDLARIGSAADKMERLLDDCLDLSRIGRATSQPVPVPLGEVAHEALTLLAGQVQQRGVEVAISPGLPVVEGDRTRLVEVLQNLVENAVKFMGAQPHPRVEIGVRRDGGENVFCVKDNGIGIEPRFHERIFGLFEKLNQDGPGSGAGLAIVKRVVEAHGGRIWVESEGAGLGCTFCFTLNGARGHTGA